MVLYVDHWLHRCYAEGNCPELRLRGTRLGRFPDRAVHVGQQPVLPTNEQLHVHAARGEMRPPRSSW